ncbi:MAG: GNAT family N-acetyltransferase [Acidobacteriota bacterium]
MSDIGYRAAGIEDLDAIVQFQVAMALETEELDLHRQTCAAGVRAVFSTPALGRYFVAAASGRIVASLLITFEWSDWRNRQVWWIQSVYVAPDFRRQGVYAGLYQHIRRLVDDEVDVGGVRLYVDRRNSRAQQVYTRLGMNGEHYVVFEWMKDF